MSSVVLSPGMAALVLFGGFFLLLILRVPVAFALGLSALPVLLIEPRLSPMVLFNEMFKSYNSFILLAVPFFLLTANLMNVGGITDRLMRLSRALVGHFPGGLAQINVLLSVFFAGISGSSTADAASQGKLFIEAQVKEGYDLSFSIAITAVSAVLAVIIPPSILMVVWGGVISTSIGAMYLAEEMGISNDSFLRAMGTFTGAGKRLQKVVENKDFVMFKDFAHSPSKLKATTKAVKEQFAHRKVIACMELHTFSSLKKEFLPQYKDTMQFADEAVVYFNHDVVKHKKLEPITKEMVLDAFGGDVKVMDQTQDVLDFIKSHTHKNEVLLMMSSGTFDGIDYDQLGKELIG